MPKNYWMVVTSPENFEITRKLGFTVQGLKVHHQRKVQRMEPGDRMLFYIGCIRQFGATATIKSQYFEDRTPTWKPEGNSEWAFKVRIQGEVVLPNGNLMDVSQLAPRLDYVRRWTPEDWYIAFAQSTLHLLPKRDFMLVEEEMRRMKSGRSRRSPNAAPAPKEETKV